MRQNIIHLLHDSGAVCVTTMFDNYGLPADLPGKISLQGVNPSRRVNRLEQEFANNINNQRFLPFLLLHEFEELLFSASNILIEQLRLSSQQPFGQIEQFSTPEEINDGSETHPAARILRSKPDYRKPLGGVKIAEAIGLDIIRSRCPHFNQWVTRLETC
nr:DUF4276 family protein [uncultured Chloroflexus sp.]